MFTVSNTQIADSSGADLTGFGNANDFQSQLLFGITCLGTVRFSAPLKLVGCSLRLLKDQTLKHAAPHLQSKTCAERFKLQDHIDQTNKLLCRAVLRQESSQWLDAFRYTLLRLYLH